MVRSGKTGLAPGLRSRRPVGCYDEKLMSIAVHIRHVSGIAIFDLSGRLVTGGEGDTLREILLRAYEQGHRWMLLNCADLTYVDRCGVGELVGAYATIVRPGTLL